MSSRLDRTGDHKWAPIMCFSATASFVAAAVTGAAGVICLTRIRTPRDLLLAATPLFFSAQQGLEGLLWLQASDGAASQAGILPLAFLIVARTFWPIYAPVAVLLAEPSAQRRRLIAPWAVVGLGVSVYLLLGLLARPHSAALAGGHMVYDIERYRGPSYPIAIAYLSAVGLPFLLSSQPAIKLLGLVVATGSIVAYVFYLQAFQSVWCYFAATASVVILAHFQWARGRARTAALTGQA